MIITVTLFAFAIAFWIGFFVSQYKIRKATERVWSIEMEKQKISQLAWLCGGLKKEGDSD